MVTKFKQMTNKISIGIDIGGTNVEIAWVSPDGTIVKHSTYRTSMFNNPEHMVNKLSTFILKENKSIAGEITGIGIGAPNGNYYNGTIEYAPNLNWEGIIPLAKMFSEKTGLKSKLTNDANAAAYAEMKYGDAKGMKNFLVITLGTGLGSGIVVDGNILYGSTGFAGELGHTQAVENGRTCGCGRLGCMETYVSATGITRTMKEMLKQSKQESLLRKLDVLDSEAIFNAAKLGDELAIKAMDYTAIIMGRHLSNYVALFSPEAIFITGGLAKAHEMLIPTMEKHMNDNMLKIFKNTCKIYPSALIEQNSGVLGAAAMLIED